MLYNFLENTAKREISSCNFNQHIKTAHPDRVIEEHDLIYIKEGCWHIAQDGTEYQLKPGDVILLQGGHHHYGTIPCESTVKTCFIHFGKHETDALSTNSEFTDGFWVFPIVSQCKNNPAVEHYFNRIIYSYWSDGEYARKKAAAYLDLLLCEISGIKGSESKHYSIVEDIKLQFKKTPHRFIGNEELAQKYCCSVRTISSKFKASTGMSLHAWQMKLKCQMAEELIRYDPSVTLKEIAANYGFYDEYHFGKCFKKIMGHSPKNTK